MTCPRPAALLLVLLVLATPGYAAARESVIHTRIVAGLPTADYPTAGALLVGDDPATAVSWCSGVLIGCQTFLTAAHCVCSGRGATCQRALGPAPDSRLVYLQHAGFVRVANITVHPDYDFPHADVAVLRLDRPVTGITPAVLAAGMPPAGSPATIVGFGRTGANADDLGIKRRGDITLGTCPADVDAASSVCWTFDGGANTCQGDSGGPLFVTTLERIVVAGITSAGQHEGCLPGDTSIDTDVSAYRAWIVATAGSDVERTRCGGLPPVGDAATSVSVLDGQLGAANDADTHTLDVPTGINELRIALNAVDDGLTNFDLYVRAGRTATLGEHDCRAGGGQYGACQFLFPTPGRWSVLVRRTTGAGPYQLTATTFGGDPPVCGNAVLETDEECDGTDDGACPGACSTACACAGMCRVGGVVPLHASLGRRLSLKLLLRNQSGAYDGLDPRIAGLALRVDPEEGPGLDLVIPPRDPRWRGSGRVGDGMRWRGLADGRRVEVRCKQLPAGHWRIRVQGTARRS